MTLGKEQLPELLCKYFSCQNSDNLHWENGQLEEPNLREITGASRAQLKTFKIKSPIVTLAPRLLRLGARRKAWKEVWVGLRSSSTTVIKALSYSVDLSTIHVNQSHME